MLLLAATVAPSATEEVHSLRSPRQAGETIVRVFLPDSSDSPAPPRLPLVLPFEAGTERRWGDPAAEFRRIDPADRYNLVVAIPTFSALPWYADHPTDKRLRLESYLPDDVLPLIDRHHDAHRVQGRRWPWGSPNQAGGVVSPAPPSKDPCPNVGSGRTANVGLRQRTNPRGRRSGGLPIDRDLCQWRRGVRPVACRRAASLLKRRRVESQLGGRTDGVSPESIYE